MMIAKLSKDKLSVLKKVYILLPKLNEEKTRIIDFQLKPFHRQQFINPLNAYLEHPEIYNIDHWFQSETEATGLIYRKSQHIYKFNNDIMIYLSMKYNLKNEVTALNLENLKIIDNLC